MITNYSLFRFILTFLILSISLNFTFSQDCFYTNEYGKVCPKKLVGSRVSGSNGYGFNFNISKAGVAVKTRIKQAGSCTMDNGRYTTDGVLKLSNSGGDTNFRLDILNMDNDDFHQTITGTIDNQQRISGKSKTYSTCWGRKRRYTIYFEGDMGVNPSSSNRLIFKLKGRDKMCPDRDCIFDVSYTFELDFTVEEKDREEPSISSVSFNGNSVKNRERASGERSSINLKGYISDNESIASVTIFQNSKQIRLNNFRTGWFEKNIRLDYGSNKIEIFVIDDSDNVKSYLFWYTRNRPQTSPSQVTSQYPNNNKLPKIWAVLVGIDRYETLRTLKYSVDDAREVQNFLTSVDGRALRSKQVKVLPNNKATKKNILKTMSSQFSNAGREDIIIFYFSGHGLEGGLAPQDYNKASDANILEYSEIREVFKNVSAKHKLIITDACYAGGLSKNDIDLMGRYYNKLKTSNGGLAVISSSSEEQVSNQNNDLQASVFTYYLIEGLKGAADRDNDGFVTVKEIANYTRAKTMRYTNEEQVPELRVMSESHDIKNMPLSIKK